MRRSLRIGEDLPKKIKKKTSSTISQQVKRFSIECCKTKTEVLLWPITTDVNSTISQLELEENRRNWRQARENACDQAQLVLVWPNSHWLRKWRELCQPIIESKLLSTLN